MLPAASGGGNAHDAACRAISRGNVTMLPHGGAFFVGDHFCEEIGELKRGVEGTSPRLRLLDDFVIAVGDFGLDLVKEMLQLHYLIAIGAAIGNNIVQDSV